MTRDNNIKKYTDWYIKNKLHYHLAKSYVDASLVQSPESNLAVSIKLSKLELEFSILAVVFFRVNTDLDFLLASLGGWSLLKSVCSASVSGFLGKISSFWELVSQLLGKISWFRELHSPCNDEALKCDLNSYIKE